MSRAHLKQSLKSLHDELHQAHHLDDESKKLLRVVLKDIQVALDEDKQVHLPHAVEALEAQALSFETKHPAITQAARALADALRKAGV